MFKHKLFLKLIFLFILGFTPFLFSQTIEEKKIIKNIQIRGLFTINSKVVLNALKLKQGEEVSPKEIKKIIRRIHALRLFEDIKVSLNELDGNEITIIIQVVERIKVDKIIFTGNETLSDVKLKEDNPIDKLKYYNENEVNEGKFRLINRYLEEGFLDVEIKVETSPTAKTNENKINVYYLINEGSRYFVKEINFNLEKKIANKIKKIIQTKKNQWYKKSYFNYNQIINDRRIIIFQLKSLGFYRVEIKKMDFQYEWKDIKKKNEKNVTINITIDQKDKYFFGNVTVRGNNIFSDEELLIDFRRKEGKLYNEKIHQEDIQSIYYKYRNNGYIFSRVIPFDEVDEKEKIVNYVIDIYEGKIGHIENIYLKGLGKTKKNVVYRELLFQEGERFNLDRINNSLRNLNRLNYFSSIQQNYRVGSIEGLMDIYLNFQEKRTTVISAGISYGFSSGFSITGELKDNNFLGYGYNVGIKTSLGLSVKDLVLSFEDPWFLNKPISLGTSLTLGKYYNDFGVTVTDKTVRSPDGGSKGVVNNAAKSIQYTSDLIKFSVSSGQRFFKWFRIREIFSINYVVNYLQDFKVWPERYSQQELYNANKDLFDDPPPDGTERLYYTLGLLFQRDNRNSIINPIDGEYASFSTTFYFGDYSLIEYVFNFGIFRSVSWFFSRLPDFKMNLTFVYKNTLKTLGRSIINDFVFDDFNFLSLSERDVRGWQNNDIRDYLLYRFGQGALFTENLFPFGQAIFKQNFEIRQNLLIDLLQVVFYLDMGAISTQKLSFIDFSSWDFIFNSQNFIYSVGFGFRLNIPQLPLRFYFSWKFIYDQNQHTFRSFNQAKFNDKINYIPSFTFDFQGFF